MFIINIENYKYRRLMFIINIEKYKYRRLSENM